MNKWIYYLISIVSVIFLFYLLSGKVIDSLEPPTSILVLIVLIGWLGFAMAFIIFAGLFLKFKYKKKTISLYAIFTFRRKFWSTALPLAFLMILYNRVSFYYTWEDLSWPNLFETMAILIFFAIIYFYINAIISFIYAEEEWKYRGYFSNIFLFLFILPISLGAIIKWYL